MNNRKVGLTLTDTIRVAEKDLPLMSLFWVIAITSTPRIKPDHYKENRPRQVLGTEGYYRSSSLLFVLVFLISCICPQRTGLGPRNVEMTPVFARPNFTPGKTNRETTYYSHSLSPVFEVASYFA